MDNDLNICGILDRLAKKRPIFHLEADFQFALACVIAKEIRSSYPSAEIYFEDACGLPRGQAPDIEIKADNAHKYFIELKYAATDKNINTKKLIKKINDHSLVKFKIKKDRAHYPQSKYDFWNDVDKLQNVMRLNSDAVGYAIFLTNDLTYWSKETLGGAKQEEQNIDKNFKIYDKRKIGAGETLKWEKEDSKKHPDIKAQHAYSLEWQEWGDGGGFKYLLLRVPPKKS